MAHRIFRFAFNRKNHHLAGVFGKGKKKRSSVIVTHGPKKSLTETFRAFWRRRKKQLKSLIRLGKNPDPNSKRRSYVVKRVIVNPADVYDYHDEDKKYADYRFTKRDQIRINSMIDKKQEEAKKRKEAKKKRKQKRK